MKQVVNFSNFSKILKMRSPSPEAKRQKTDGDGAESMSIEETNAMRVKLGLAPLEITRNTMGLDKKYHLL